MDPHHLKRFQLKDGSVARYGMRFPPKEDGSSWNELELELILFNRGGSLKAGTDKYFHCRNIIGVIFPELFVHSWLERTLKAFCDHRYVGITGAANSAKSFGMALWGLISWWAAPIETCVLVISTTKTHARERVWAHIQNLFRSAALPMPGKLLAGGSDKIALREMASEDMGSDASGIILVAGGESDALDNLQGKKNQRMIVLCDEAQSVSNMVEQALWNLTKNPYFEFRCAGNPAFTFDFHGRFCEPIRELGGHALDYETLEQWPIKPLGIYDGMALHFNSLDSPNFALEAAGQPLLTYLPRPAEVRAIHALPDARQRPEVWRQDIGVWPRENAGIKQTVFTDPEIAMYGIKEALPLTNIRYGMGIDPAWVEDGDDYVITMIAVGDYNGKSGIVQLVEQIVLSDAEVLNPRTANPVSGSVSKAIRTRAIADKYGISAAVVGVDVTGNIPFADALDEWLGGQVLRVGFGESANREVAASLADPRMGNEVYTNKATELWRSLHALAEHGQLKGVNDPQVWKELTLRKYKLSKTGKEEIERKGDFKKRTGGKSPDRADSLAIAGEVARVRMGAVAGLASLEIRQAQWVRAATKAAKVKPQSFHGVRGIGSINLALR